MENNLFMMALKHKNLLLSQNVFSWPTKNKNENKKNRIWWILRDWFEQTNYIRFDTNENIL